MTVGLSLLEIFMREPQGNEVAEFLAKRSSHALRFRYGVSPGTIVYDLWRGCDETAIRKAGGKRTSDKAINTLAENMGHRRRLEQLHKWRVEAPRHRETPRVLALADVLVTHWRGRYQPLCLKEECRCGTNSEACAKNVREAVRAFLMDSGVASKAGYDETYFGPPLGISARAFVEHAVEHSQHIVIPVDPSAVVKWWEESTLFSKTTAANNVQEGAAARASADAPIASNDGKAQIRADKNAGQPQSRRTFAGSFDDLREGFLANAKDKKLKVIYVLKAEPGARAPVRDVTQTHEWLVGEGLYRVEMERVLRDAGVRDVAADSLVWFVPEGLALESDEQTLFPKQPPFASWSSALDDKFDERPRDGWIFAATVAAGKTTEAVVRKQIRFTVSPIGDTKFGKRYGAPVIPVAEDPKDGQLRRLIAQFVLAATHTDSSKTVTGWKKVNVERFLSEPAERFTRKFLT